MAATGTEGRVCADIAERQLAGIEKYRMTVEGNPLPLRAWLQHAYFEALDMAIYLKRAIEQIDGAEANPALNLPLAGMDLSIRVANAVYRFGLRTVGDLADKSEAELLRVPNFGRQSLREVKSLLLGMGLTLRPSCVPPRNTEAKP